MAPWKKCGRQPARQVDMSVSVIAEALGDVQRYFEQLPEIAMQAATMAINSTAERKALPDIRAEMRETDKRFLPLPSEPSR